MTKARILSTKKITQDLVERIHQAGLELVQHEFIQTVITIPDQLTGLEIQNHIVLTSSTAVQAWLSLTDHFDLDRSAYKIFCLDQATRRLAQQHDLPIEGTASNSAALAEVIASRGDVHRVTFVCSNLRRDELPTFLRARKIDVHEIIGYQTELTPIQITPPADAVLFFSPSGVDSYRSKNNAVAICFCIGETTAAQAKQNGFQQVFVADVSSVDAVVTKTIQYYSKLSVHA